MGSVRGRAWVGEGSCVTGKACAAGASEAEAGQDKANTRKGRDHAVAGVGQGRAAQTFVYGQQHEQDGGRSRAQEHW